MNGRGRPEKLTDEIKEEITKLQSGRKKKLKAPAIQEEIRLLLETRIKGEKPAWSNELVREQVEQRLPGISSIQKYLKDTEERDRPSELDKPWCLGLMVRTVVAKTGVVETKYEIPAEAVPNILAVQDWGENVPDTLNRPREPLTVRQALWVARLYGLVGPYLHSLDKKKLKHAPHYAAQFLWLWSEAYAQRELICSLSGTHFDTTALDKGIRTFGLPQTIDETTLIFYPNRSFYIDTIDENLLQQIEQMKKDGEK